MEHDAWFFIGVFVFIFLVWVVTGGPLRPISFTGPSLPQPAELGGGTYLQLPRAPLSIGNASFSLPGSSNDRSIPNNPGTSFPAFVGGSAFGVPSPYRSFVRMNHYVSGAGSINPNNEYVEIAVAQNAGVPVNISGWQLTSDVAGNSARIPKGTEVPTSGTVNAAQDIVLTPGERALIISGQSPIGASFRENKCIGYFSTFQQFSPPLPQNCPAPSDELTALYGGNIVRDPVCVEYVNKLSRCQVMLSPPVTISDACQSFLIKYLNYNGCADAHRSDPNFMGDTWHIYLGRVSPMWRGRHEVVRLLDAEGKTVDAFNY